MDSFWFAAARNWPMFRSTTPELWDPVKSSSVAAGLFLHKSPYLKSASCGGFTMQSALKCATKSFQAGLKCSAILLKNKLHLQDAQFQI